MKKFFLPILAVCGMVAGFTLSSCGGGGSNGRESADITGLELVAGDTTPIFRMSVTSRMGRSNLYEATYTFGRSSYAGTFSMTEGYPLLNEDGQAEVSGRMALNEVAAFTDRDFIVWLGGAPNAIGVQIETPVTLTIKAFKDSDSGVMERNLSGVYIRDNISSVQLPTDQQFDSVQVQGTKMLFKRLKPAAEEEL